MEQWPLPKEKLLAATELVQEQLLAGHIEPSNSPWNTPIFVIKKKSGKWRLLQDLRAINKTMVSMGALQPGLPSPVAIPKNNFTYIIDLQDCFFTIPLHPDDCFRFAFSLPSPNFQKPYKRYQWRVLPQGMKNSPTLCQKYVADALTIIRQNYPNVYIIHYMDDILLSSDNMDTLKQVLSDTVKELTKYGLKIAPDKIQMELPLHYLGRIINSPVITIQPIQLRTDKLNTLNDFQKLLGDINWLRPYLKLTTKDLKPLFDILKGDSNPNSERHLNPEANKALQLVEQAIQQSQLQQLDYHKSWMLLILFTEYSPMACLWQDQPIEWISLSVSPKKNLITYLELVAQLISKGRKRSKELFAQDPQIITVPITAQQFENLLQNSLSWAEAFLGFLGEVTYHLPGNPLLLFLQKHPFIFPKLYSEQPLDYAALVFTDGSSNGKATYQIDHVKKVIDTCQTSAQRAELIAVTEVFKQVPKPFNLYSDSQYVTRLFPAIETVVLSPSSTIVSLLQQLQQVIRKRTAKYFVGHIRSHSGLPGPLTKGNAEVDLLTKTYIFSNIELAIKSHNQHHQNSKALRYQFKLTKEQARQVVCDCPACMTFIPSPKMGVNPRGLKPNILWQMDVTHIPSFGKLSFVHVSIDTYSHLLFASARSGEAYKDVVQHMIQTFAFMGVPKQLKTDNAPVYTSKNFQNFCKLYDIEHSTGIPYNPQGQAIVERSHQILKNQIEKITSTEKYYSPHHTLQHALFVINYLNIGHDQLNNMERHWKCPTLIPQVFVKWKDLTTGLWKGPDILLASGRGYSCVFPQDKKSPIWIPDCLVRTTAASKEKETSSSPTPRMDGPVDHHNPTT